MAYGSSADSAKEPWTRRVQAVAMQLFRAALLFAIVWQIHQKHTWYRAQRTGVRAGRVSLGQTKPFYPPGARLEKWDPTHGGQIVVDSSAQPVGYVIQTAPISNDVVGFAGPTNSLIAFDDKDRILGIAVLESGDTVDHVDLVVRDPKFLNQFNGLSWEEARQKQDLDAVSGATLTSLAIVEGIGMRLGNSRLSIRFPRTMTTTEVQRFLPDADRLSARKNQPRLLEVFDTKGNCIGSVFRTSPAADSVIGYQGPTDVMVVLDSNGQTIGIGIRSSYDNEPYVRYVREDSYFFELFHGKTLEQLTELDPNAAEIEGVSGATMTSMAIAFSIPKAAADAMIVQERSIIWSMDDLGTLVILAFAALTCFTPVRRSRAVRFVFRVVLIIYIGFVNGSMLSQALLVGWAQNGIPWRLAPGLVLLCAAAFFVPVVSKRNLYCHHFCPFGAAQQLIRNRVPRRIRLPRWSRRFLSLIPAGLLFLVLATAMLHWSLDLTGLEPFGAFSFTAACTATFAVAAVGIVASILYPMAYCRFGCPSGALLGYMRLHRKSYRWSNRDTVAVLLFAFAFAIRWL